MLVLTRKIGEKVCIGSDVEIVVLDAGRGRVKLGFAGSRDVAIRRGELAGALNLPNLPAQSFRPEHSAALADSPQRPLHRFRVMAAGG